MNSSKSSEVEGYRRPSTSEIDYRNYPRAQPKPSQSFLSLGHTILSLVLLFLSFFLAQYDRFILSYFQLPLTTELHISSAEYGILSGYATGISFAILSIPLAYISDRSQARLWILTSSIAWWSLCVLFQGLAKTYWQLACARVAMGIGQSAVEALSVSLISDIIGPRRFVTTGEGVLYVGIYVGEAISGQISTVFRKTGTSWRWALKGVGIFGLGLAVVLRLVMWREPSRKQDITRASLRDAVDRHRSSFRATLRYIIRMRSFWLYTLSAGIRTLAGVVFGYYMPGYLQQVYPNTINLTSIYGIIVGVVGSTAALLGGLLTSMFWHKTKLTPLYLVSIGGVLSSVFVILMVLSRQISGGDEAGGTRILYGTMSAAYITAELWLAPVNGLLILMLPPEHKTFAFAIYSTIVVLIYSSGPQIVGLALRGVSPDSENYAADVRVILAVIIPLGYILSSIGFGVSIPLVKRDLEKPAMTQAGYYGTVDRAVSRRRRSWMGFGLGLLIAIVIVLFTLSFVYRA